MFYKTRIFVTLSVKGNELLRKGGCFYVDVPIVLPMKQGEYIDFNGFTADITKITWSVQHMAMMVYTGITEVEEEIIDGCVEYLTYNQNFKQIGP